MGVLKSVISYINSRPRPTFCLDEVLSATGLPRKPTLRALNLLEREGYLDTLAIDYHEQPAGVGGQRPKNPCWKVTRDPKERPTGRILRECGRARMWRLIRAKKFFTKHDLVIFSGAAAASVDDYVRILAEHGYIRATGKDGRRTVYMLTARNQVNYPPLNRKPKEVAHGS
jgi:hypothetical protein